MTISQTGLNLIKQFESCRLESYPDVKGIWTIGWGHTGPEVVEGLACTQEQADGWLMADAEGTAGGAVNRLVKVPLSQNQFDALCCFTYNVGQGNLADSTLLKLLNQGLYASSAEEFPKWDRAGGVQVAGLLRRRQAEKALFLS